MSAILVDFLTIEDSVKGIRADGTTRSPVLLVDPDTGNTIIRALAPGGSVLFQDAAGASVAVGNAALLGGQNGAYYLALANATGTLPWASVTKTGSSLADLATRSAGDLSTGTLVDARVAQSNVTQHQSALSIAASQLSGTLANARVAQSNVTQHEGALAIGWAQITGAPTTLSGYGITDALAQGVAYVEMTDSGSPSNPASGLARIYPDATGKAIKAVFADGTTITLGSVGGAISDAYSSIAGTTGTASASGGSQLSILGAGGISTAAADATPDTLTITLGNHSASLLTSGTIPSGRVGASAVTQHQASLSIGATQLTGTVASARLSGSYTGITGVGTVAAGVWNGTAIDPVYGGTGLTSYATGDIVYASASNTLSKLAAGTNGHVLTLASGIPSWAAPAGAAFVGVRATRSTNQSVPNGTYTAMSWNTETFDTNTYHDNSTNNSRLTIPSGKSGKYFVHASINFSGNSAGDGRYVVLYKNGVSYHQHEDVPSTLRQSVDLFTFIDVVAGDYLEIFIYQNSGAPLDVVAAQSFFELEYRGA